MIRTRMLLGLVLLALAMPPAAHAAACCHAPASATTLQILPDDCCCLPHACLTDHAGQPDAREIQDVAAPAPSFSGRFLSVVTPFSAVSLATGVSLQGLPAPPPRFDTSHHAFAIPLRP